MESQTSTADDVSWREYNVHDDKGNNSNDESSEEEEASNAPPDIFATQEENACEIHEYNLNDKEGRKVIINLREQEDYDVSTGMSVWKGSEILCHYLLEHPHLIREKRVTELGSGVGLCGIVSAKALGASTALLTDGDHVVLRNLRRNVELNGLSSEVVSCPQLIWGESRAKEFEKMNGKQDVILATDCVYVTKSVRPLFETVASVLVPKGVFLFVNSCASICPLEKIMSIGKEFGFVASPDEMWYQTGNDKDPVYVFRKI